MKLYLIKRTCDDIGYDEHDAFVVRASNPAEVRRSVALEAANEGADEWLNEAKSTVIDLTPEGTAGIILSSFHAG